MASNPQDEDWQSLARLAHAGDNRAYTKLLTEIVPFIRRALSGRFSNADAIDDVVQEVLISVHKALHTYSPDRAFKPWLNAIIRFRTADYLRSHYAQRKDVTTSWDDMTPGQKQKNIGAHVTGTAHVGEYKDVERALETLPDKQRKAFKLMRIEGYTAQEVADKTGMSVAAVKVTVHRATHKIKQVLNG